MNPHSSPLAEPVRGVQSIERATYLLRLVAARHVSGIGLRELVASTGLDRTTAHRIVSSLLRAGLIGRDADSGAYRLGIEAMALGLCSMQRTPLVEACVPMMKALARRTAEHVFLVVRSGDYSQCLHLEAGARPISSFAETVGSMRLLGLGIPSFALLARMQDAEVAAHWQRHQEAYEAGRMSWTKLQRWIAQTRAQGYAHIAAKGLGGVGQYFALGSCGDAALGIVAPASRAPRSRGPALAAVMQAEMQRLQ